MTWGASHLGVYLAAIPVLMGVMVLAHRIRKKRLSRLINPALWSEVVPSLDMKRRFWVQVGLIGVLTLIVLGLMRPQWGYRWKQVVRQGQDIVILVDTSLSMAAQDVKPSRFSRAKQEVLNLISNLKGDRVGLVVFSGRSFTHCPLTLDYGALRLFLQDMSVGMISKTGTDLAGAIDHAATVLSAGSSQSKIAIIVTDGESFAGDPVSEAKKAAKAGIQLFTIGVGSSEGEPLPLRNQVGKISGYKKDKNSEVVLSRLDAETLKQVAKVGRGKYYESAFGGLVAESLYKDIFSSEQEAVKDQLNHEPIERYPWFILPAVLILVLVSAIPDRAKRRVK